jgi:predicted unusual protein kinase regulating ubiquinone biosynthesis (AarF/ABC1/UbiB family)
LFQADPHLSNILALPGGDVASIDYGLVCELSRQEAKQAQDLIIAVYLQDIQRTVKVATEMTGADYQTFAPILRPHLEIYLEKTKNEGFGFWFLEFAKIMVKNKIQFPLYLTTFGRTNLMLDGLVKTYLPNKTTVDLVGNELKRAAMAETLQNVADIDWLRVGYTLSKKVKQTPEFISALVESPLDIISEIAKEEGYTLEPASAEMVALLGDGSFRDTLGILQKVITVSDDKKISPEEVALITGAPRRELLNQLVSALEEGKLDDRQADKQGELFHMRGP